MIFWDLTLREVYAISDGVAERLKREQKDRAWLAWHIAALTRTTKMPKLEKLVASDKPKTPQDWQAQLAIAQQWASVTGAR